ncbi:MAG: Acetylglutamate kinase [Planctomycetota bacterium]|jgi:acetylglutamate kinase
MRPLVIKLGGALLDEPQAHAATFDALADAVRSRASVLVHGGGKAVDRQLERLGMVSRKRDGIRITPPEQMEQVQGVLAGCMNGRLVGQLLRRGVRAVGLSLGDGGLLQAALSRRFDFDPGRVGELSGGDPLLVTSLLAEGFVPVLSSIAMDAQGEPLNVNADEAAAAVARLVRAERLVLLTDVPGVLDGRGHVVPRLDAATCAAMIETGQVTGGMIAKVRGALEAASVAGVPVLVCGWSDPTVLARLADADPPGTRLDPAPLPETARV